MHIADIKIRNFRKLKEFGLQNTKLKLLTNFLVVKKLVFFHFPLTFPAIFLLT